MHKINEEIKNKRVMVVGDDGKTEMSFDSALNEAYNQGLDLVEMSEKSDVSVCKIMSYNKYLYEQKKSKKSVKKSIMKDIKFGCNIADHDLKISANKACSILNEGNKVRVIAVFKGRQMTLVNTRGTELFDKFMSFLPSDMGVLVTKTPKLEGMNYSMILDIKGN